MHLERTEPQFGQGNCLSFSLTVEAVIPAVEADSAARAWSFTSSGCGLNASAPRVDSTTNPWTPDDVFCESSDGQWSRTSCWICFGQLMTPPQGIDTGDWTVTLGDLTNPSAWGPYVNVPLEVSITDWGDASHLVVTATATKRDARWWFNSANDWGFDPVWGGTSASTTITVPRRSGPPPSDDVIEVNIGEVDDLPVTSTYNQQRVQILRSQLLANDACPVGTDCADPYQWPIQIVGDDARRCSFAGLTSTSMLETAQGVVGCDGLNEVLDPPDPDDPPSALYWPELWAVGDDTFSYRTYGGDATVTIRFTDQPPSGVTPVTSVDLGHTLNEAEFPRTDSAWFCTDYIPWWQGGGCDSGYWQYTFTRDDTSITDVLYHSGVVSLPTPTDADGDYAGRVLVNAAANADVEGGVGVRSDMMASTLSITPVQGFVLSTTDIDTGDGGDIFAQDSVCLNWETRQRIIWWTPITWQTYRVCTQWQPEDVTIANLLGSGVRVFGGTCEASTSVVLRSLPLYSLTRYIPVSGQTECVPADAFACPATLDVDAVCYSARRLIDQPSEAVVPYIACDDRYFHFLDDQAGAEAAGHTVDDYCTASTVTVHLGGPRIETNLAASHVTATEGSPLSFEVQLGEAAPTDVVVDYTVTPVTATAGIDYLIPLGQVTIPAGDTTATIQIATVQDNIHELDETLVVDITTVVGASLGTLVQATGTITNDDPLPQVTIGDVSVSEDASVALNPPFDIDGDGIPDTEYVYGETLRFTVTLVGESDRPITVAYDTETTAGTATSVNYCQQHPGTVAEDYRPESGTLTFSPGDTSETFTVTLCPDDQYEGNETLIVTLSSPTNATLGTASATGTIVDNDVPAAHPSPAVRTPPRPRLGTRPAPRQHPLDRLWRPDRVRDAALEEARSRLRRRPTSAPRCRRARCWRPRGRCGGWAGSASATTR